MGGKQRKQPFRDDPDEISAALQAEPPRVEPHLDAAAVRTHPALAELWRELRATAEAARGTEPELPREAWLAYAQRGERVPYETPYFARRTRLFALALEAIFGDDTCLPALKNLLLIVCDEPTWALPAHVDDPTTMTHRDTVDLFAAETGQALAEIRSLLGDRLSPDVSERIRREVTERLLDPMLPGTPVRWWETAPMNWAAVCAGSVLMAALQLESDPRRRSAIVHRCLGALDHFLDGFGDDGCCLEGVAYWSYGFGYFTAAADLLERASGGQIRLADDPRARRAAAYGHRVDIGPTRSLSYSDVGPGMPNTSTSAWWSRRGIPSLSALRLSLPSDDPCGRWALLLRTLLWSDPLPRSASPHADVFPDSGLVVVHRGAFALCVKGGHNDEPHNHLDLGHVSVWLGDEEVIADIGSGIYHAAYFGEGRYGFLHPSARAHNAPILEQGPSTYAQLPGSAHRATLSATIDAELNGQARLDLTSAYGDVDAAVHRSVTWEFDDHHGTVTITDDIATDAATAVISFMTRLMPTVEGTTVRWPDPWLHATLAAPDQAQVSLHQEPTLDHDGNPVTWWRIETRTPVHAGTPLSHRLMMRAP